LLYANETEPSCSLLFIWPDVNNLPSLSLYCKYGTN